MIETIKYAAYREQWNGNEVVKVKISEGELQEGNTIHLGDNSKSPDILVLIFGDRRVQIGVSEWGEVSLLRKDEEV